MRKEVHEKQPPASRLYNPEDKALLTISASFQVTQQSARLTSCIVDDE